MKEAIKNKDNKELITLKHYKYNEELVKRCKLLGAKMTSSGTCFEFSDLVENEAEKLDKLYNSELKNYKVKVTYDIYCNYFNVAGYKFISLDDEAELEVSHDACIITGDKAYVHCYYGCKVLLKKDCEINIKLPVEVFNNLKAEECDGYIVTEM